jgi:hypothetical protein
MYEPRNEVSLTGIDQCGFVVDGVSQGTDTFQGSVHSSRTLSFQDPSYAVSTLTNAANGKVVTVDTAGRDSWSDAKAFNPDDTTTHTETLTGRDARTYTSHSNVLLQDVGYPSPSSTPSTPRATSSTSSSSGTPRTSSRAASMPSLPPSGKPGAARDAGWS